MDPIATRRGFLLALGGGAAALWLADSRSAVQDAAEHAAHNVDETQPRQFEFFNAVEARTAEAVAARILPNDDGTPGAREAGAVYFMDRVAARHLPQEMRGTLRDGLTLLSKDTRAQHPNARDFAALTSAQQDALLRQRETTPFFEVIRTLTLGGVLSSQKYGGNRNNVGWKMVRHDPAPVYTAPFGYYDRPSVRRQLRQSRGDA